MENLIPKQRQTASLQRSVLNFIYNLAYHCNARACALTLASTFLTAESRKALQNSNMGVLHEGWKSILLHRVPDFLQSMFRQHLFPQRLRMLARASTWLCDAGKSAVMAICKGACRCMPVYEHCSQQRTPKSDIRSSSDVIPSRVHALCVRKVRFRHFDTGEYSSAVPRLSRKELCWQVRVMVQSCLTSATHLELDHSSVNINFFLRCFAKVQNGINLNIIEIVIDTNDESERPFHIEILRAFPNLRKLETTWIFFVDRLEEDPWNQPRALQDTAAMFLPNLETFKQSEFPWGCVATSTALLAQKFRETRLDDARPPGPPSGLILLQMPSLRILNLAWCSWWPVPSSSLPALEIISLRCCTSTALQVQALLELGKSSLKLVKCDELPRAATPLLNLSGFTNLSVFAWSHFRKVRGHICFQHCSSLRLLRASQCRLLLASDLPRLEVLELSESIVEDHGPLAEHDCTRPLASVVLEGFAFLNPPTATDLHRIRGRTRSMRCNVSEENELSFQVVDLINASCLASLETYRPQGVNALDRLLSLRSFLTTRESKFKRLIKNSPGLANFIFVQHFKRFGRNEDTFSDMLGRHRIAERICTYLSSDTSAEKKAYACCCYAFIRRHWRSRLSPAQLLWRSASITSLDQIPTCLQADDMGANECPIITLSFKNYRLPSETGGGFNRSEPFGNFFPLISRNIQCLRLEGPVLQENDDGMMCVVCVPDIYQRIARQVFQLLKVQQLELLNTSFWVQEVDISFPGFVYVGETYYGCIKRLKLHNVIVATSDSHKKLENKNLEELIVHEDEVLSTGKTWCQQFEVVCSMPLLKVLKMSNGLWLPSGLSTFPALQVLTLSGKSIPSTALQSLLHCCRGSLRALYLLHLPAASDSIEVSDMLQLRLLVWHGYSVAHRTVINVSNCKRLRLMSMQQCRFSVQLFSCARLQVIAMARATLEELGTHQTCSDHIPMVVPLGDNVTVRSSKFNLQRQAMASYKLRNLLDPNVFEFESSIWPENQQQPPRYSWLENESLIDLCVSWRKRSLQGGSLDAMPRRHRRSASQSVEMEAKEPTLNDSQTPAMFNTAGVSSSHDVVGRKTESPAESIIQPGHSSCRARDCARRLFHFAQPRIVCLCSQGCSYALHDSCFSRLRHSAHGTWRQCMDEECGGGMVLVEKRDGDGHTVKVYHKTRGVVIRSTSREKAADAIVDSVRTESAPCVSGQIPRESLGEKSSPAAKKRAQTMSKAERKQQRSCEHRLQKQVERRAAEVDENWLAQAAAVRKHVASIERGEGPEIAKEVVADSFSDIFGSAGSSRKRGRSPRRKTHRVGEWGCLPNRTLRHAAKAQPLLRDCLDIAELAGGDVMRGADVELSAMEKDHARLIGYIRNEWRWYVHPLDLIFVQNSDLVSTTFCIRCVDIAANPEDVISALTSDSEVVERLLVAFDRLDFPDLNLGTPQEVLQVWVTFASTKSLESVFQDARSGGFLVPGGPTLYVEAGNLVSLKSKQDVPENTSVFGIQVVEMFGFAGSRSHQTEKPAMQAAVSRITFTRPCVGTVFHDGRPLYEVVNELLRNYSSGATSFKHSIVCIRVGDDTYRALTNRKLWCYKALSGLLGLDVDVPIIKIDALEAARKKSAGEDLSLPASFAIVGMTPERPITSSWPRRSERSVKSLHFTHDHISPRFRDGRPLHFLVNDLCTGAVDPCSTMEPLRVVWWNGAWRSLSNRRLWCLKVSCGVRGIADINTGVIEEEFALVQRKFEEANSTSTNGMTIQVRESWQRPWSTSRRRDGV